MNRKNFKKKMAILMTTVMATSILPVSVFASTDNNLTKSLLNIPLTTVLVEDAVIGNQEVKDNDDIIYVANGTDLVVELNDPIEPGDTFTLKLTNAVWFFRSDLTHVSSPSALLSANSNLDELWKNNYARTDIGEKFENTASGWETDEATEKWSTEFDTFGSTYNINEGVWGYDSNYDNDNKDSATEGTYYRTGMSNKEIPYALTVSPIDDSVATVMILADDNGDGYVDPDGNGMDDTPRKTYGNSYNITIPLVVRTLGAGDASIQIISDGTSISSDTLVFVRDSNVGDVTDNKPPITNGTSTPTPSPAPEPTKTPTTTTKPKPNVSNEYKKAPLMLGDPSGSFRPTENITRGEVAQVLFNSLYSGEPTEDATFADVDQNRWYSDAIDFAYSEGYMSGYPDGTFQPDAPITRAEVLVILNNVMGYPQYDGEAMFNDISEHWAYEAINNTANALDLGGFPDGSYKPDDSITRGDFAIILAKATDRADYSPDFIPNDVYVNDYYYEYVMSVVNYSK